MPTRRRFLLNLAGLAATLKSVQVARAEDAVVFGVSVPLSGSMAEFGRTWRKAQTVAVEEINEAGGIKGRKIELVYEDSQGDPKQTVAIAQKFVDDRRILAVLGDIPTPAIMAASPVFQKARMVQMSMGSHPDLTKAGEFIFANQMSQRQIAASLATIAVNRLGKTQAVLYRNTDWGKVVQSIYVEKLKELGGQVVLADSYLETEKDFRALLAKVRAAKPEVLVLIAYYTDGALLVQQAKQAGVESKIRTSRHPEVRRRIPGQAQRGARLLREYRVRRGEDHGLGDRAGRVQPRGHPAGAPEGGGDPERHVRALQVQRDPAGRRGRPGSHRRQGREVQAPQLILSVPPARHAPRGAAR